MKKLIIYLNYVEPVKVPMKNKKTGAMEMRNKIYNVLSFPIKNDKEVVHHLSMNSDNVKSHRVICFK